MIRFKAKTEEQVSKILGNGRYTYKLLELKPVKTKDGSKDMAYIKVEVHGREKRVTVEDRIPFTEKMEFKWRHFCYSCGLNNMYESEIFEGKPSGEQWGELKLGIEEDLTGQYPPKNKVLDYIVRDSASAPILINEKAGDDFEDDDIPF